MHHASFFIFMFLFLSGDEIISGIDPIYDYLDHTKLPSEIFCIRADFTGDGKDDVLLTDDKTFTGKVYLWSFYEWTANGYLVHEWGPAFDVDAFYVGKLESLDTIGVVKFVKTEEERGNLYACIYNGKYFDNKILRSMDLTKPDTEKYLNNLFSNMKTYYEVLQVKDLPLNLLPEKYKKISTPQQEGELDTLNKTPLQEKEGMSDSSTATVSPPTVIPKEQPKNSPVLEDIASEPSPIPPKTAFPSNSTQKYYVIGILSVLMLGIMISVIAIFCRKACRRKA